MKPLDQMTAEELLTLFCQRTGVSRDDANQLGNLSTAMIAILNRKPEPDKVARVTCGAILEIVIKRMGKAEA